MTSDYRQGPGTGNGRGAGMRILVEKAQKKDLEVPVLAAWRLMDFLCVQKRKKVPAAPVLILKLLKSGAGNEVRTRDPNHGKVMLYQLSYSRNDKYYYLSQRD